MEEVASIYNILAWTNMEISSSLALPLTILLYVILYKVYTLQPYGVFLNTNEENLFGKKKYGAFFSKSVFPNFICKCGHECHYMMSDYLRDQTGGTSALANKPFFSSSIYILPICMHTANNQYVLSYMEENSPQRMQITEIENQNVIRAPNSALQRYITLLYRWQKPKGFLSHYNPLAISHWHLINGSSLQISI